MPLLDAAPMKTPTEATIMIVLNEAALEPIAEVKKLTASLLTPTNRSNTAKIKRKMIIPKNKISIL